MANPHGRAWTAVVIGGALFAATLWLLAGSPLRPAPLARSSAAKTAPSNGCRAAVTSTVEPDALRLCDRSAVSIVARPECPVCPGGVRIAFVQREVATEGRWMNDEALSVLDEVERLYTGADLRAAVVHYGPGGARAVVKMTNQLADVRDGLSQPRSEANPPYANDAAAAAAREALAQLKVPTGEGEALVVCQLVVFFAEAGSAPC